MPETSTTELFEGEELSFQQREAAATERQRSENGCARLLSPKGGRAGFVRCLTMRPLPFRIVAVTAASIRAADPGIGSIFFVPGQRETLRVTRRAIIVRDQNIRRAMADRGRVPDLAIIADVEKASFHCGKCITPSNLWNYDEYQAQARNRPSTRLPHASAPP